MSDPALATSADYADAMLVARRAKNWLFFILLIMLLGELAMFFVARYTGLVIASGASTTQPAALPWLDRLHYLTALCIFIALVAPILLSFVLLLIVHIMLVGRLIGVGRVTAAYLWCILLALLLFPWQAFLNNATFSAENFKIPGVLYTWNELILHARFHPASWEQAVLGWTRFFIFPIVALILLFIVQITSNRGLRQALGEADPQIN